MKALVYHRYGSPEEMEYLEVPVPKVGRNELLVKIKAGSINPADWVIRKGTLRLITGRDYPKGMGIDFAGIVEKRGSGVLDFEEGDEVLGSVSFRKAGTLAELAVSQIKTTVKKSKQVSYEDASCLGVAGCSVMDAFKSLDLKDLDVLVLGCTGGVGHIAVQVAKIYGARMVTGVCSSSQVELAKSLGVDEVIDYQKGNLMDQLQNIGRQFDVILDTSGILESSKIAKVMKPQSICISIAGKFLFYLSTVSNLWSRKKFMPIFSTTKKKYLEQLQKWIIEGKLKIVIGKSAPLKEAKEILQSLEEGKRVGGKVVLIPE